MLLQNLLMLFDNPLSHEQTWAVGYMLTKSVSALRFGSFAYRKAVHLSITLDTIDLNDEGEIAILAVELSSRSQQYERDLISSIGDVLCRCLNYGLKEEDVEHFYLEDDMAELIGRMVLQFRDDSDEGFDDCNLAESWSSIATIEALGNRKPFQTLDDVMCFCEARLVRCGIEGGIRYYPSICSALHVEATEFETFLNYISKSTSEYNHNLNDYSCKDGDIKQLKPWAKLWLTVMKEIRMVTNEITSNEKDEHFDHVPSENISERLKTESEKILCQEKEFLSLPENARELVVNFLLGRIKKKSDLTEKTTKRRLDFDTEAVIPSSCQTGTKEINEKVSVEDAVKIPCRKESKIFSKLGNCKVSPELNTSSESDLSSSPKKVLHVPTPLKVENWINHEDLTPTVNCRNNNDMSSLTILQNKNRKTSLDSAIDNIENPAIILHEEEANSMTVNKSNLQCQKRLSLSTAYLTEIDIENGMEKNGKLGATFFEICKTRQEITRAETEMLHHSNRRALEVKYGKVCFGCKNVTFGLFRKSWACEICRKKFCSSCIQQNIEIASHLIDFSRTESYVGNFSNTKSYSLSVGDLSTLNSITPYPCRGQSVYEIGKKKLAAGPLLHLCKECNFFIDSIMTETRNSRWQVRLQLDL